MKDDGSVTAEQPNDAISEETLQMILDWKRSGLEMNNIIDRLRSKTIPPGYPIHPWCPGRIVWQVYMMWVIIVTIL